MASLQFPLPGSLLGSTEESFEYVPFLLGRDQSYLDEPSAFLRDRASGRWHPSARQASVYHLRRLLSQNSIRSYGWDLQNFFSFLEATGLTWQGPPEALLAAYDRAMADGSWSADARSSPAGLRPATINRRIAIALEFLCWASDRALRPFRYRERTWTITSPSIWTNSCHPWASTSS